MSEGFAAVPNWIVRDELIHPHAKLTYLVLSSHTGRSGTWEMGHAQIATEAGVSVSAVQRALKELRDLGVIDWTTQREGMGNRYWISSFDQSEGPNASVTVTEPIGHPDRTHRSEGPTKKNPKKNPKKETSLRSVSMRGSRLPESFKPTQELHAWADSRLIPRGFQMEQTERFVDYWLAATGARAVKADWAATWRNWIRRAWETDGARWQKATSKDNPETWA